MAGDGDEEIGALHAEVERLRCELATVQQDLATLRLSEARFRTICDAFSIGIVFTGPSEDIIYSNAADREMTGLTAAETLGLNKLTPRIEIDFSLAGWAL